MDELSQTAATLGVSVTPQALEQRFTPEAAETLKQVLDASIQEVIFSNPQAIPLLQRFKFTYKTAAGFLYLLNCCLARLWWRQQYAIKCQNPIELGNPHWRHKPD